MIVSILLFAIITIAIYVASHRLGGTQLLAALALFAAGIVLVVWPDGATYFAQRLHVGRGADLITYLAIIGGLFAAANFYFRFKRQEQQLIAIVRELAIRNPRRRSNHGATMMLTAAPLMVAQPIDISAKSACTCHSSLASGSAATLAASASAPAATTRRTP